ncbi:hypothetical protein GC722_00750 [Auraticoccus sp. F435]|uniref:Uncharacterized protein n=1 Tax=Auraticoccus cholistanensis TaxID=2656650 RepID=A0A6A9V002_9ACTN|nr:hypothetical protein [Auraticoccus cholistanensis]
MSAPTSSGRPRPASAGAGGRGRRRRTAATLLVAVLALLPAAGPLGLVLPARAVEPDPQQVSIALESVEPAVLDRDARLTVRGTATNSRDTPVSNLQLLLWRDQGTLYTDQAQLDDLVAAPSTLPVGARVLVESAYTSDLPAELGPGQSVPFELSATVEELGLPPGDGAALVGVQAREDGVETVGRVRTLVPVVEERHPPVAVASVVVMSAPPSRVRADVVAGESLGAQLAPGGRLDVLLGSAAREDVSWAVDPLLLAEVGDLADGYRVLAADGAESAGGHQADAARWLTRFEELDRARGYRLPWGVPDLLAVARSGEEELTGAVLAAQPPQGSAAADLPLLLAPAGGTVDAATLDLADRMQPAAVALAGGPGSAVHSRPDAAALVDVSVEAFDPQLGPDPRASAPQVAQHLLTSTLVESLTAQGRGLSPAPQVRVVDSAERAAADAVEAPGWQRRLPLAELLAAEPTPWSGPVDDPAADLEAQLDPSVLDSAAELRSDLQTAQELLTDPGESQDADRTTSAALSSWWRAGAAAEQREAWLGPRRDALDQLLGGRGLQLSVAQNVAMSARSGQFPVSITNRLDQAVRVRVVFSTDNPGRISIPAIPEVVVRPGQTVTTTAAPRARANGSFNATARLATVSGRELGPSREVRIEASDIGRAGWVIVIGSGIVLVGGTVLRVRQVRRQQARAAAAPDPTPSPRNEAAR